MYRELVLERERGQLSERERERANEGCSFK